jgi:hypothetical protein
MSLRAVVHSNSFRRIISAGWDKEQIRPAAQEERSLCAVAIKMIKVIFALLRDKREFQDTVSFALAA